MSGVTEAATTIGLVLGIVASIIAIAEFLYKALSSKPSNDVPSATKAGTSPKGDFGSRVWTIDRRHVVAMLLGAALYALVSIVSTSKSGLDFATVGHFNVSSLPLVVAAMFGATLGPLAGLFVGAVGYVLTGVPSIGNAAAHFPFPPPYSVSDGIVGFIAGLSLGYTQRRFRRLGSLVVLEVAAAVGVTAGDICAYAIGQSQGNTISAQTFVTGFQSDLIGALVLLPIVMIVFCEAINRRFPLD
jgi:hypothetical protein